MIYATLSNIQRELKAPKAQFNKFGGYNYRNCEDILEAVKPIAAKYGAVVFLSDELEAVNDRYYIKATAHLVDINDGAEITNTAWAREEETKKGMDGSQITGASSSYARKYALNGLFAIDDTKDSDFTNTGDTTKKEELATPVQLGKINAYRITAKLIKKYKLTKIEELTRAQAAEAIKLWEDYLKSKETPEEKVAEEEAQEIF